MLQITFAGEKPNSPPARADNAVHPQAAKDETRASKESRTMRNQIPSIAKPHQLTCTANREQTHPSHKRMQTQDAATPFFFFLFLVQARKHNAVGRTPLMHGGQPAPVDDTDVKVWGICMGQPRQMRSATCLSRQSDRNTTELRVVVVATSGDKPLAPTTAIMRGFVLKRETPLKRGFSKERRSATFVAPSSFLCIGATTSHFHVDAAQDHTPFLFFSHNHDDAPISTDPLSLIPPLRRREGQFRL